MENLIRILKAVDYMEENLTDTLSLEAIAGQACLSEYYFHKLFHLLVGDTPGEYIKKRRMHEAARLLNGSGRKVIDVALDYGYQSPEAFSRAFTRHFGFNPADIKGQGNHIIPYPKPALTLTNLTHIQEEVIMEPRIIERKEMKVVGPVYYGNNEKGEIPEFWQRHFGLVAELDSKTGEGCYGICFHTSDYVEKGLFHYMPAVEVKDFDTIPITAVGKIIPRHTYAVFTHRGSPDTLGETYKYIHGTWFPRKDYDINETFDFEHYTADEKGHDIIELHIPIFKK